jgi:hypothetical protein
LLTSSQAQPQPTSLAEQLVGVLSSPETQSFTASQDPASSGLVTAVSSSLGEAGGTSSAITSTIVLNPDGTTTATEVNPTTQEQRITIFAASPQGTTPQVISSTSTNADTTTTTAQGLSAAATAAASSLQGGVGETSSPAAATEAEQPAASSSLEAATASGPGEADGTSSLEAATAVVSSGPGEAVVTSSPAAVVSSRPGEAVGTSLPAAATASGPGGADGTSLPAAATAVVSSGPGEAVVTSSPAAASSLQGEAVGTSSLEAATAEATVAALSASASAQPSTSTFFANGSDVQNILSSLGFASNYSNFMPMITSLAEKVQVAITSKENFPTPREMAELVTNAYNESNATESQPLVSSQVLNYMTTFAQRAQTSQNMLQQQFAELTTPMATPATSPQQVPAPATTKAQLMESQQLLSAIFSTPALEGQQNIPESTPLPIESQNGLGAGPIFGITISSALAIAFLTWYVPGVWRRYKQNQEGYGGRNAVPDDTVLGEVVTPSSTATLGFPGAPAPMPASAKGEQAAMEAAVEVAVAVAT